MVKLTKFRVTGPADSLTCERISIRGPERFTSKRFNSACHKCDNQRVCPPRRAATRRWHLEAGTLSSVSVTDLLATMLEAPHLPNASCVAERNLFDAAAAPGASGHELAAAVRVCSGCKCLVACRAFVDSLPARRIPYGVTGAQIRRPR
jgi:hypothetical protein